MGNHAYILFLWDHSVYHSKILFAILITGVTPIYAIFLLGFFKGNKITFETVFQSLSEYHMP